MTNYLFTLVRCQRIILVENTGLVAAAVLFAWALLRYAVLAPGG